MVVGWWAFLFPFQTSESPTQSGLEKKKLEFQLVLWSTVVTFYFPRATSCSSKLKILLQDDLPVPLTIGKVIKQESLREFYWGQTS